jgi:biopolymer transport protein ExbB
MRQRAWFGSRWAARGWLVCVVVLVSAFAWTHASMLATALAQDDAKKEAAADDAKDAKAPDAGAADLIDDAAAPAAAPAAPAKAAARPAARDAAAAPEAADKPAPPPETSLLSEALQALGWFYTVSFLILSFLFVALMVMNLLTARRENIYPSTLIEGFEKCLDEKQYQEAYELAKSDDSYLGQVLAAGLSRLSAGYSEALEAMQEVAEDENMKMDHRLSYMALIGTVSPMLGLFGTVDGMIRSFSVIAHSVGTPPPSELAKGVATALWTTLVGLAIAMPAVSAFGIIKNFIDRRVLEVGVVSERLMGRFENVGTRKK